MAAAALLSVTLVPALMMIFVRGRIIPEAKNPLNRALIAIYRPVIRGVLKAKTLTIALAVVILAVSVWPVTQVGSEFMPNLNEGTLLYMPTTLPGLVGYEISRAAANPGPHHQIVPRGRLRLRQSGPRADRDRSGADRNVRDRHQPQAEGGMAAGTYTSMA